MANAFITPFKERLNNYHHFKDQVQVKGFDSKPEVAVGSGSITLIDYCGNKQTLNDVAYVSGCTEQILSLMKLHRLYGVDFAFTSLEEFKIPFPNGVFFPGKSVNNVLYIWESTSFISNTVTKYSTSQKRKIIEINEDDVNVEDNNTSLESETFHPNTQPIGEAEQLTNFQFLSIGERERQHTMPSSSSPLLSTTSHCPVKPLYCFPNQLWHLHFGYASTTTFHKLQYIKSSHNSTRCIICIHAKQTHKLFLPSVSEVSRKLEWIHSDICGPFPTLKGLSNLLLTFLDKSFATVNHTFRRLIKQIETKTELKIKYLWTDSGSKYECDFKPVFEEMGIWHKPTVLYSPQSNGKAEWLNRTLKTFMRAMLYQANMPKSF